ncbi:Isochorismatase hydrolase [Lichtheimia hyalospora FSU 10163]|nr:Isochorismatase hydrolase [Lichtheimia hyalospora FSU 10163]
MKQALIVVDVQNDYFPGGNLPTDHPIETAQAVAKLITKFRQDGKEVVFVQHITPEEQYKDLPIMKDNSKGAEIHELVRPLPTEKVVRKHHISSFVGTDLDAYLKSKEIDTVVAVGMMIHNCVNATVYDANVNGYQCFVVDEAVNTFDQKLYGEIIPAKQIKDSFLAGIQFFMAKVVRLDDALNDKY